MQDDSRIVGVNYIIWSDCRLDPARFKDGLRTLIETKASNEQIDKFMKLVQSHNVSKMSFKYIEYIVVYSALHYINI